MTETLESLTFMVRVSEASGRFDQMYLYLEKIIDKKIENAEEYNSKESTKIHQIRYEPGERNLFASCFKNLVDPVRESLDIVKIT